MGKVATRAWINRVLSHASVYGITSAFTRDYGGPAFSGLRNTGPTSVATYNNIPKHVNTLEWARHAAVGPRRNDGQSVVVSEPTSAKGRRDVVSPLATWTSSSVSRIVWTLDFFFPTHWQDQSPHRGRLNNLRDERLIRDLVACLWNVWIDDGNDGTGCRFSFAFVEWLKVQGARAWEIGEKILIILCN